MKSSNLAERLEEFDATLGSLRLIPSPATRQVAPMESAEVSGEKVKPARRASRLRRIEIRGHGLRSFRVF